VDGDDALRGAATRLLEDVAAGRVDLAEGANVPADAINIGPPCRAPSLSPTGAKSPSGSSARAASLASARSPCTPTATQKPSTSAWPTRPTPSVAPPQPRAT